MNIGAFFNMSGIIMYLQREQVDHTLQFVLKKISSAKTAPDLASPDENVLELVHTAILLGVRASGGWEKESPSKGGCVPVPSR